MGILDDAIREHLELKRQHGAAEAELKELEDEAFGPPERPGAPDPFAEAPTEFMAAPEVPEEAPEAVEEPGRREPPSIADLQEGPEPLEAPKAEEPPEPLAEEQPAMEHEVVSEPPPGHTTEEREAIASHPTEHYDVEEEIAASEPVAPSEEDLAAEEVAEPRLMPEGDPLAGLEQIAEEVRAEPIGAEEEDEEDSFFDEQRLSDELDQALEGPAAEEDEELDEEDEDFEDEDEVEEDDEPASPRGREEDLLEDTPDFLEDAPEDDRLWFEQKPPKDFDFDD
jgi:hypothetical protein